MAVLFTKSMDEGDREHRSVYPLFQKGSRVPSATTTEQLNIQSQITRPQVEIVSILSKDVPRRAKQTKTTSQFPVSNSAVKDSITIATNANKTESFELDPNDDRRKRQKTAPLKRSTIIEGADLGREASKQKILKQGKLLRPPKDDMIPQLASETDTRAASTKLVSRAPENGVIQRCQGSIFAQEEPECGPLATDICTTFPDGTAQGAEECPNSTNGDLGNAEQDRNDHTLEIKPKRILRFNPKTGTIGSPHSQNPHSSGQLHGQEVSKRNGQKSKILMVVIRYGPRYVLPASIGPRIDQILKISSSINLGDKAQCPEGLKSTIAGPAQPVKPLHPLFLGKAIKGSLPATISESGNLVRVANLPNSLESKTSKLAQQAQELQPRQPRSGFVGFGNIKKVVKFPNAIEPAWPWRDMLHIRGQEPSADGAQLITAANLYLPSTIKKSKYQAVEVMAQDDILQIWATQLNRDESLDIQLKLSPEKLVRRPPRRQLPLKHLESGLDLRKRAQKEIRTRLTGLHDTLGMSSSDGELNTPSSPFARTHQALVEMYKSIPKSLSAFDRGECEVQAWNHKYAPKTALEVLQVGRESLILKEWLLSLTVKAVEMRKIDGPQSRSSSMSTKAVMTNSEKRMHRKRKSKKLQDFVVSTDDEEDDMDEISEPEDIAPFAEDQGLLRKTVIRVGDLSRGAKDSRRLTNAVIISGPHGCGKTAAVYAVAKELGFEVFEINASSRRSGKDILERVGDMTRNHLVQRSQRQPSVQAVDEEAQRASEALAKEINSGRQGTMNAFFKTQASAKPKSKAKAKKVRATRTLIGTSNERTQPQSPAKQPKQSLLLFEEVDIVYEEDKQFWAAVINLISQSKRPVIMTCTDESLVPLQSLALHAIIRFAPPPIELAVDYMLLIAACEGHAVKREAVKALYESRDMDLRASLTELNFWCQFAVGDSKNGLGWYLSRFPEGSDVDKYGDKIRVVSEDSFRTGMGWLCEDSIVASIGKANLIEEILHEAWDGWRLDVADPHHNSITNSWAVDMQNTSKSGISKREALCNFDAASDALSAADIFSGAAFALDNQILVDCGLPQLSAKAREDYILGRELLDAPDVVDYDTLGTNIALWMKSRSVSFQQLNPQKHNDCQADEQRGRTCKLEVQNLIRNKSSPLNSTLTRRDFSLAFDPISEPENTSLFFQTGILEASIFDRTLSIIATDVAPYVRSIVAYDARLQNERARMSNLLSEGGRRTKRMRTTRAAVAALEGGVRSTTRRDKYFGGGLNSHWVLRTGSRQWLDALEAFYGEETRSSKGSSIAAAVEEGSAANETDEITL